MTNRRPTLSATIITLNEEEALPKLLRRLNWVDEVLVVDSGSTDRTVAIAKHHGCRVLERPFDDFASQRNFALEQARGSWVLSVDADELPSPGLATEVRRCIQHGTRAGYRIPIRSTIFGRQLRFCGTQDDQPVRLARRDLARWHGKVHETLQVSGRVASLHAWLEHETLVDFSEFLSKMNRYTSLEVERRLTSGCPPRRGERWLAPLLEVGRRLVWKWGLFDGPEGWAFCLLSGVSAWLTVARHRAAWEARSATPQDAVGGVLKGCRCGAPAKTGLPAGPISAEGHADTKPSNHPASRALPSRRGQSPLVGPTPSGVPFGQRQCAARPLAHDTSCARMEGDDMRFAPGEVPLMWPAQAAAVASSRHNLSESVKDQTVRSYNLKDTELASAQEHAPPQQATAARECNGSKTPGTIEEHYGLGATEHKARGVLPSV